MSRGTEVSPLAAGAGAKDTLRKEEKKQVKRKQLWPFLHVSSGVHHISTSQVSAHLATLCSYIYVCVYVKNRQISCTSLPCLGVRAHLPTHSFHRGWSRK